MGFTTKEIHYFENPGSENTADAIRFAVERARDLGLKKIVVASTSGKTALAFLEAVEGTGIELIVVSHVVGFSQPGVWDFSPEAAARLRESGARVVTGTHIFSGLERALTRSKKVTGGSRTEAVGEALRRIVAVGLKVAVECVLIAADRGAAGEGCAARLRRRLVPGGLEVRIVLPDPPFGDWNEVAVAAAKGEERGS